MNIRRASRPLGYTTLVQSKTQNKAQSLRFILSLRMNSSFITSRPAVLSVVFYYGVVVLSIGSH